MKKLVAVLVAAFFLNPAHASFTAKRAQLENIIRDRVYGIVAKFDAASIVQVQINLKKVESSLPVFGYNAEVTPLEYDGELGSSSIQNITVRILTQNDDIPTWLKAEVDKALQAGDVKIAVTYEKAGGPLHDKSSDLAKLAQEVSVTAVKGLDHVKFGVWAIFIGVIGGLAAIAYSVMSFAKRLETSLAKVIEEKVVPALQQSRPQASLNERVVGEAPDAKPSVMQIQGGIGGGKELADVPFQALLNILSDCYWTEADGYAHYIWTQITQEQREKILAANQIDAQYFSYVRQVAPNNLNYHTDARYLMWGKDFASVNQDDLVKWLQKNPKLFYRITPLRWDLLPLSLEERIRYNEVKIDSDQIKDAPLKLTEKSKPRVLQSRLQVKRLSAEDEEFLWKNSDKVPAHVRPSLRSLVWLALAPVEHRTKVLAELDARQLAEAWTGPESVLASLKEVLAPKKLEMLNHFLTSTTPDRESPTFAYLFESGLQSLQADSEQRGAA